MPEDADGEKSLDITKEKLSDTLIDLCESMRLSSITVGLLVKEAGVARQTFYNHFSDMNDLVCFTASRPLLNGEFEFMEERNLEAACRWAMGHKGFYSQLGTHTGQNGFRSAYNEWLMGVYRSTYAGAHLTVAERAYRDLSVEIYVAGSTEALLNWFATGMEAPLDSFLRAVRDSRPAFMRGKPDPTVRVRDYPR